MTRYIAYRKKSGLLQESSKIVVERRWRSDHVRRRAVRNTPKRVLPAVNLTTTRNFVYFAFRDPAEAQDAYAYFLYHKQLGR
jgi:hypothetical protein